MIKEMHKKRMNRGPHRSTATLISHLGILVVQQWYVYLEIPHVFISSGGKGGRKGGRNETKEWTPQNVSRCFYLLAPSVPCALCLAPCDSYHTPTSAVICACSEPFFLAAFHGIFMLYMLYICMPYRPYSTAVHSLLFSICILEKGCLPFFFPAVASPGVLPRY